MKQGDAKVSEQNQLDQEEEYELGSDDQGEHIELDQEQVIEAILALGNQIWENLGQTEQIEDVSLFFEPQFYVQVFSLAYPRYDFSSLLEDNEEGQDPQLQAALCIQALIDLLASEILENDMSHILGAEITKGNPKHVIDLLQILQQISEVSRLQEESGNEMSAGDMDGRVGESPDSNGVGQGDVSGESPAGVSKIDARDNGAGKRAASGPDSSDNELMELNKHLPQGEAQLGQNLQSPDGDSANNNLFGDLDDEDEEGMTQDKQQFLDNLDDDLGMADDGLDDEDEHQQREGQKQQQNAQEMQVHQRSSNMGADKVGDVLHQQLDIEFDEDIQDNIQIMQGQRTDGSSAPIEDDDDGGQGNNKQMMVPLMPGQAEIEDDQDDDEIVDHNDVNIIDDGADFGEDEMDDNYGDDSSRNLNRQTENMADFEKLQGQQDQMLDDEDQEGIYEDDIVNDQNSSNFQMHSGNPNNMIDGDDDGGLAGLHDQLKNLDQQEEDEYLGGSQQIIDDQNLKIMGDADHMDGDGMDDDEDEGQHHDDDDDEDLDEQQEMFQLEQLEQMAQNQNGQQEDEDDQNINFDDLGDLGQAAQQLGLDEEGLRALEMQKRMYDQQQMYGDEENMDYGEGEIEGEDDSNNQEDLEMEMRIQNQHQDDMDDGEEENQEEEVDVESDVKQQILRGGQNIEEDPSPYGQEDEDEDDINAMAQQIKQIDEQDDDQRQLIQAQMQGQNESPDQDDEDDQDKGEDEDEYFDLDNLDAEEKAILMQYLQEEYQKNPNSLPMPMEQYEQLLADTQGLLNKDQEGEGEEQAEYGQEQIDDQGIDSSEIIVENNEGAMIIQGEDNIDDEQQDQYGEEIISDENDQKYDQNQMQLHAGEINIEGGEQNIDDENDVEDQQDFQDQDGYGQEDDEEEGETTDAKLQMQFQMANNQLQDIQLQGQQQQDYGQEDQEDLGEDDELDDPNQPQIFNPQYQLDELQQDEDGNDMMIQNINVGVQQQQMSQQQQMQQMFYQQQMQVQQNQKRVKSGPKKKKSTLSKKPPMMSSGGFERNAAKPLTMAASKKFKRARLGVNTISHDDENKNPNSNFGIDMATYQPTRSQQRKTTSQRRPQTAKTRGKNVGVTGKAGKRYNNYIAGTPSNRLRTGKPSNVGAVSTHNMMVPQQSQMFTSFGLPQTGLQGGTQRRALSNPRKRYSGIYGSTKNSQSMNLKTKKLRSNQFSTVTKSTATKATTKKSQQIQMMQMQNQQQQQQQFLLQQQNIQQANANAQNQSSVAQNLVEMPILSEEFLNQLNEEQLQALLEQQQQLMMLQQQNQQQNQASPVARDGTETGAESNTGQMQAPQNMDEQQLQFQQALILQQQQQLKSMPKGANLRSRGRVQSAKTHVPTAARIPSEKARASGIGGSGSRSRHGSKKRGTNKTRSSLNVGPIPLNNGGQSLSAVGLVAPLQGPNFSNSVSKSQKLAAQIYGNSGDNMMNSLMSQRKKPYSLLKKGGKKRSQPNQGLAQKNLKHQIAQNQSYNLQAQIQAQQAQYDMMNQQQQQQQQPTIIQGEDGMQYALIGPEQTPYQVQIGQDGQPVYIPLDDNQENQNVESQENGNLENEDEQQQMLDENLGQMDDEIKNEGQGIIDEVSPEQEDGESQNQFQSSLQQKQQMMMQMQMQNNQGIQSNIMPIQATGGVSSIADDLSTEQIIELLQNAQNNSQFENDNGEDQGQLPEEVQIQLQQVLQQRIQIQQQQDFLLQQQQMVGGMPMQDMRQGKMQEAGMSDRVQSYQNICNILTESVSKAKDRYAHLAPGATNSQKRNRGASKSNSPDTKNVASKNSGNIETDQRIMKQKQQFESLLKQYKMDQRKKENKRMNDIKKQEKIAARDEKIRAIKQKRFEEEMLVQQRSQMFKRNAQQVRLCKKVYKLASDLEKNKLLDEKKMYKETEKGKDEQKKSMVQTIENYYKDKINMLKDRISREKFERQVASEAQKKALNQMKRELDDQKRKEVQRYIQLLQQEDDKYDIQNMDLGRLQNEIVKLYKKQ